MNQKRIFLIVCLSLLVIFYFLYPKIIVSVYGKKIPEIWNQNYTHMNFEQIYQQIGKPQEDLSGKGYQNWLIYQWWGWQMLRISLQDCCPLTSQPTDIIYIVHVNGWYEPAHTKVIK